MNAKRKSMHPNPGVVIAEELRAKGWTAHDLICITGMGREAIEAVLSGEQGIDLEMALALGDAFEVNPDFFLNIQRSYDLGRT